MDAIPCSGFRGKAKQIDFLIQKAEEENERYKEEVSLQRRREV